MDFKKKAEEISFETGSADFDTDQREQLQKAIEKALKETWNEAIEESASRIEEDEEVYRFSKWIRELKDK